MTRTARILLTATILTLAPPSAPGDEGPPPPVMPTVELKDYRGRYDSRRRRIELSGKLSSAERAHSVVVVDNMKQKPGPYWKRSYADRLADDGTFRVSIDEPVPSDGLYEIYFCFENGVVTGDGRGQSEEGALVKPYRFSRVGFEFTN